MNYGHCYGLVSQYRNIRPKVSERIVQYKKPWRQDSQKFTRLRSGNVLDNKDLIKYQLLIKVLSLFWQHGGTDGGAHVFGQGLGWTGHGVQENPRLGTWWGSCGVFSALWQVLCWMVRQLVLGEDFVNFCERPCPKLSEPELDLQHFFLWFGFVFESDCIF